MCKKNGKQTLLHIYKKGSEAMLFVLPEIIFRRLKSFFYIYISNKSMNITRDRNSI